MREKMEKDTTMKEEEMAHTVRAAKNARTTEQCVEPDATTTG